MKPTDFRDATYRDLARLLCRDREQVYRAWLRFGPGTTREVAIRAEMSLFTFRPRSTQLYQAGLLEVEPGQRACREGRYRAVDVEAWKKRREALARPEQMVMGI
ncbi:MAG TPA: hypothetical protein PKE26_11125 [Kiritimatiellia bacterium]|nr:hypothetical protein [Kiritimatiellia bacterium]